MDLKIELGRWVFYTSFLAGAARQLGYLLVGWLSSMFARVFTSLFSTG
jgi:hypothetical protein